MSAILGLIFVLAILAAGELALDAVIDWWRGR